MNLRGLKRRLLFGKAKRRFCAVSLFSKASWLETDLEQYFARFAKLNLNSEETKLIQQNFCLRTSSGMSSDSLSPGPYRDASYTLALYQGEQTDKNPPEKLNYLSCIGFNVEAGQIVVRQIQGNPGKGEILRLFKWERMLLAILTDWARQSGFSQIKVIQAKDSGWYREYAEERIKRMFMHYDVTAKRSGFSFDQSSGQYVKILD